jgi:hypothetical protein
MKSVLRLVKSEQPVQKKQPPREQRFRHPAEEVWEVSCRDYSAATSASRTRPSSLRTRSSIA